MIKKINSTKRSANSNALNRKFHNNQTSYPFKIIDQTSNSNAKKVVIYTRNTASGFDEYVPVWKEFFFGPQNTNHKNFNFYGDFTATGFFNSIPIFENTVIHGKKYILNSQSNQFELYSDASSATEIQFLNNKNENLCLILKKSNSTIITENITPSQQKGFTFNKTIYIAATYNLTENVDISVVNTQISLFGVTAADIVMTGDGIIVPFTFSLQNIIF